METGEVIKVFNILVVEDDPKLGRLFATTLTHSGYRAFQALDAEEALQILDHEHIDLMISDVMMPGMDGFSLTRALREAKNPMPVLIVTAKSQFLDKQQGFTAGGDDYMVKPVDVNEMVLRVGALLRRAEIVSAQRLTLGGSTLAADTLTVTREGVRMELPQKEFYLLFKLASCAGRIFTRQQLMDEIWGADTESDPHTVEVHVARLREKLKGNPDLEIVTIRGLGYKVAKP